MRVTRSRRHSVVHAALTAAAVTAVFATAFFFRLSTLGSAHDSPVETAYLSLAMKMGSYPGLSGYHPAGVEIRRKAVTPADGLPGRAIPIAFPVETDPSAPRSFDAWPPEDSNPFYYKAPMLPALLNYTHHRILGPRFPFYPVLASAAGDEDPSDPETFKNILRVQGWAAAVPAVFGLAVVLLTLAIGWRSFGPAVGIAAAFLVAADPVSVLVSGRIWPESVMTAFVLAAALFLEGSVRERNWAGYALAGVFYLLAVVTDHTALYFLPAFGFLCLRAGKLKHAFLSPCFAAFAAACWAVSRDWRYTIGPSWWTAAVRRSGRSSGELVGAAAGWDLSWAETAFYGAIASGVLLSVIGLARKVRSSGGSARDLAGWGTPVACVLVYLVARGVHAPGAPWDARAIAPLLPFAALAAAWGWCRSASVLFGAGERAR